MHRKNKHTDQISAQESINMITDDVGKIYITHKHVHEVLKKQERFTHKH